MSKVNLMKREGYSIGDAAVDGLLNGVIAGVAMAIYMLLMLLINNVPLGEIFSYFRSITSSPVAGTLVHLAVSGIYGVVFGLAFAYLTRRWGGPSLTWLALIAGLVYGAILWFIASTMVLSIGSTSPLDLPGVHLIIAHLFYGLLLGILSLRSNARTV